MKEGRKRMDERAWIGRWAVKEARSVSTLAT
jgi:hypothetical protein